MSVDYTPASFSGSLPTATGLTNELAKIATAFDECLSTQDTNAQQMEGDLDMNGHSILNAADLIVTDDGTSLSSLENALNQEITDRANEDAAEAAVRLAADNALQDQINLLGSGVTDHGDLTGLADDDHPQYHNNARGDARYYTQAQVDTALAAEATARATGLSTEATNRNNGDQNLQDQIDSLTTDLQSQALGEHSDVDTVGAATGQSLVYNGSEWVPQTVTSGGGGSGVTDHGALTGLGDDDHTQYHNNARGDVRYYLKAEIDAMVWGTAGTSNTSEFVEEVIGGRHYYFRANPANPNLTSLPSVSGNEVHWYLLSFDGWLDWDNLVSHMYADGQMVYVEGANDGEIRAYRVKSGATTAEKATNPSDPVQTGYVSLVFL